MEEVIKSKAYFYHGLLGYSRIKSNGEGTVSILLLSELSVVKTVWRVSDWPIQTKLTSDFLPRITRMDMDKGFRAKALIILNCTIRQVIEN